MSEKRPVSVNLSEENIAWIDNLSTNEFNSRSEFIDELITECRESGGQMKLLDRMEAKRLEAEKEGLKAQLDVVDEKLSKARRSVKSEGEWKREKVEEAVDTLGIDPAVGHDHAAAENWAEKANMGVKEFWNAYTEAYNERDN